MYIYLSIRISPFKKSTPSIQESFLIFFITKGCCSALAWLPFLVGKLCSLLLIRLEDLFEKKLNGTVGSWGHLSIQAKTLVHTNNNRPRMYVPHGEMYCVERAQQDRRLRQKSDFKSLKQCVVTETIFVNLLLRTFDI